MESITRHFATQIYIENGALDVAAASALSDSQIVPPESFSFHPGVKCEHPPTLPDGSNLCFGPFVGYRHVELSHHQGAPEAAAVVVVAEFLQSWHPEHLTEGLQTSMIQAPVSTSLFSNHSSL